MAGGCALAVARFLVFAIPIYFAVLIGTATVRDWLGHVDRDGGSAMALAFFIAPAFAFVGGVLGSTWLAARQRRNNDKAGE